jgi:3-dehydrosphinganine reductase
MVKQTSAWRGKVAFIAGGSSGIGLACARLLVAQGARIWILARRQNLLDEASAQLQIGPGELCGAIRADLTQPEQVQAALEQVVQVSGLPDLVINSVGTTFPAFFENHNLQVFHHLMEVNYFGAVYLAKAIIPGMVARGSGHLVNVASMAAQIGVFGYTAYTASKFALRGFSDSLRCEVSPKGVRLSLVFPPDTDTPQLAWENSIKPPELKALETLAGILSPDEVAEITLRDAARGRYIIVPGMENKLLFRVFDLAGSLSYPILDWLTRQSKRKVQG